MICQDGGIMEWYEDWFNQEYLTVYGHRDLTGARRETRFVLEKTGLAADARILDVACGGGRHLQAFAESGWMRLYGVDLSKDLLRAARLNLASLPLTPQLIRADMRALPCQEKFDLATMFFTSFGYFATDDQNLLALNSIRKTLKPGGWLFMDYLNEPYVRAHLVPCSRRETVDMRIEEKRTIDEKSRRLVKKIDIHQGENRRSYVESVRLYNREQLLELLTSSGFRDMETYGDLQFGPLNEDSERLYLFATRGDYYMKGHDSCQ